MTVDEAFEQCTKQAETHYENFPVGSFLVPADKRRHIHAVYAFARTADDFADETFEQLTVPERVELIDRWEAQLDACLRGQSTEPIFLAVRNAIDACRLPPQLFRDLLSAFRQDVLKSRYADFEEVLDYCRRSANPVGRLVLHIFNYRDERRHELSDQICTALQLANFWQDISVDIATKDRVYLPASDLQRFGVTIEDLRAARSSQAARELVRFQVNRTWEFFNRGRPLPELLDRGLDLEIRLTWLGGAEILRKIERLHYNTLETRPVLSKWDFARLLFRATFEEW